MQIGKAVVIGGGHAGIEACAALSRLGVPSTLVTLRLDRIGWMSCNPSVGGLAKSHVVREIDAMGGLMGKLTDGAGIQFRRLNTRKGPAVRSTRVQVDMFEYARLAAAELAGDPLISLVEDEVLALGVRGNRIRHVDLASGRRIECQAAIVTSGTFLQGRIFIGEETWEAGRMDEPPARGLSASLAALGFKLIRLKTGTPARLDAKSIDFSKLILQEGDVPPPFFHWNTTAPRLPQICCHLTHTTTGTHDFIRAGLDRSPLFTGRIVGVGPRYCPSIEDKVVRFPDREQHHVFLEPTGLDSSEVYPGGISSSLPRDVQEDLLHSIPGLESCRVIRHAYGIEYDAVDSTRLSPALASNEVEGLYFAGQVNGTSGYEEAAGQGLMAGLNAGRFLLDREPVVLGRNRAYIGVMIDDLTSIGSDEPYRLFTSRSEHRLLLREANAERRLTSQARELGLVGDAQWTWFSERLEREETTRRLLEQAQISPSEELEAWADKVQTTAPREKVRLLELVQRPGVTIDSLRGFCPELPPLSPPEAEDLETELKFGGYIRRQEDLASRLSLAEEVLLPPELDYHDIFGLTTEVVEKLTRTRPRTIGAASRIPGITPAALTNIMLFVQKRRGFRPKTTH